MSEEKKIEETAAEPKAEPKKTAKGAASKTRQKRRRQRGKAEGAAPKTEGPRSRKGKGKEGKRRIVPTAAYIRPFNNTMITITDPNGGAHGEAPDQAVSGSKSDSVCAGIGGKSCRKGEYME
jgi:hypothetical protein